MLHLNYRLPDPVELSPVTGGQRPKRGFQFPGLTQLMSLPESRLTLTEHQKLFISEALSGKSLFLTGKHKTGKTTVLRVLMDSANDSRGFYYTGTTGLSATKIGPKGMTLQSFAGVWDFNKPVDEIVAIVESNEAAKSRWLSCKTLVIDEASTLGPLQLSVLSDLGKRLRRDQNEFGGIAVILVADLLKLPPYYKKNEDVRLLFTWDRWDHVFLRENHYEFDNQSFSRDPRDSEFLMNLNHVRHHTISEAVNKYFTSLSRPISEERLRIFGTPIHLTCSRYQADKFNEYNLSLIDEEEVIIRSTPLVEEGMMKNEFDYDEMLNWVDPDSCIKLKVGTPVLLISGHRELGTVVRFVEACAISSTDQLVGFRGKDPHQRLPVVHFHTGRESIVGFSQFMRGEETIWQVPLVAFWAINLRRAQGATFKNLIVDYQNSSDFPSCKNMVYAALCCSENVDGLQVIGFTRDKCFNLQGEVSKWLRSKIPGRDERRRKAKAIRGDV